MRDTIKVAIGIVIGVFVGGMIDPKKWTTC